MCQQLATAVAVVPNNVQQAIIATMLRIPKFIITKQKQRLANANRDTTVPKVRPAKQKKAVQQKLVANTHKVPNNLTIFPTVT